MELDVGANELSASNNKAAKPATIGVAILVPDFVDQPCALLSPKRLECPAAALMSLPGATTDGFSSSHRSLSPSSCLGP